MPNKKQKQLMRDANRRKAKAVKRVKEKSKDHLREWVAEYNPEALMADGFEEAILGIAERCSKPALVVYDAEKCIEILSKQMSWEDGDEYFRFNTLGAWVGEGTPLFLWRDSE